VSTAGDRRTILLIDDDDSSRQLLRIHLSNAGYGTLEAEDAIAGGRLLVEHAPDLVILEADLPFLTCLDLIATIAVDQSRTLHAGGVPDEPRRRPLARAAARRRLPDEAVLRR
jgi:CheY-like chemotaxis protein